MGLIDKIRERSGLAVGVVAIGLILFLVGGDLLSPQSILMGTRKNYVGTIDGNNVDYEELQQVIERLKVNVRVNQDREPNEEELRQIREQAWQEVLFNKGYKPNFADLGIAVTEDELNDMVLGEHPHPAIQQAFVDSTGKFNRNYVQGFLQALNTDRVDNRQRTAWQLFIQSLPNERLRTKYEGLINQSVFANKLEAKAEFAKLNATADIEYLYVPYATIPDSTIEVSASDLKSYYNKLSARYQSEESRTIKFVYFPKSPSKSDTAEVLAEITELVEDFKNAENDTAFANLNTDGTLDTAWKSITNLPAALNAYSTLDTGMVVGPVLDGDHYSIYKVVGARSNSESASLRAAHILFKAEPTNIEEKFTAKAKAQLVLDSLKKGADFATMALRYGSDGTSSRGGDLGWFGRGQMVKPFEDACFNATSVGLLPQLVETDFGYHIVSITNLPDSRQFLVFEIQKRITPSQATIDEVYAQADNFAAGLKGVEDLEDRMAEYPNIMLQEAKLSPLMESFNGLQDVREVIRWAFNDAKLNAVSEVKEAGDGFVIAALTKEVKKGVSPLDEVADQVKAEVLKDKKFEAITSKLTIVDNASFADIAKTYGEGAVADAQQNLNGQTSYLNAAGYDPAIPGIVFGLKPNMVSKPYKLEAGVIVVKNLKMDIKPDTGDLSAVKAQIVQRNKGKIGYSYRQAFEEKIDVKDNRVKYF